MELGGVPCPPARGDRAVDIRGAGEVLRCSECEAVLLRLVTAPDRIYLELTGMACIELARP